MQQLQNLSTATLYFPSQHDLIWFDGVVPFCPSLSHPGAELGGAEMDDVGLEKIYFHAPGD